MGIFTDRLARDMKRRARSFTLSGAGVVADGTDQSGKIQSVIDQAQAVAGRVICDVEGVISLGSTVNIGNLATNSTRRNVIFMEGSLRVQAIQDMDILFDVRGTVDLKKLNIEMDGKSRVVLGIYNYNVGRSRFGSVLFNGFLASGWAIDPLKPYGTNNNNCFKVEEVQGFHTGSSHSTSAQVTTAWSGGMTAISSNPAYSEWTLQTPLPRHMRVFSWLVQVATMSDGRIQTILDVSSDGKIVKIAHENRPNGYSETLTFYTSALHWPYNPDAGAWSAGMIDISSCPNAASMTVGGYGGNVDNLTIQYNALGVMIPLRAAGFNVGYWYSEGIDDWLFASHVNHRTAGTTVSIGAGQKTQGDIQIGDQGIADQGYMTMTGRNLKPKHWLIVGHFGDSPVDLTPTPLVPRDLAEHNPGTRNITPGTIQAYTRASGAFNFRIDNNFGDGVGLVTLGTPKTGGGTDINISLLATNKGQNVEGSPTYSFKAHGETTLAYWRENATWRVRQLGPPNDVVAAINGVPSRIGQTAVVSGTGYIATGTTSTSDWKQIT